MTATRTRRRRGHDTERAVAAWFAARGWPYAEPVGAGRGGTDVTGMPGLLVEVKARRDLRLTAWLAQHSRDSLQGLNLVEPGRVLPVPFVVHRPDGYGPERIAGWPVTMRLDDFTVLLRQAGYGTEPPP